MATEVIMPKLTHEMSSGVLIRWLAREGQAVKKGDVLFEVETDKAVSEVTANASGILKGMSVPDGSDVPVGKVIAYISDLEEYIPVSPYEEKIFAQDKSLIEQSQIEDKQSVTEKATSAQSKRNIMATPVAKKIAREKGIDLTSLKGSGPNGGIIERDLLSFSSKQNSKIISSPKTSGELTYKERKLDQRTRIMAERMLESVTTIPQFSLEMKANIYSLTIKREDFDLPSGRKPTFTALFLRAAALSLRAFGLLNASFINEGLVRVYDQVNIGVAFQSGNGLLVPVIHQTDQKNLIELQDFLDSCKQKSESNNFTPDELSDGTFTISNLGVYGVDRFTALVNPPQAGILAIGKVVDQPLQEDDHIIFIPMVDLCLTADHRFITGAYAAQFLKHLCELLAEPHEIFID